MTTKIHTSVTPSLLSEWDNLSDKSPYAHFHNSSQWFIACQKVFRPARILIIACYESKQLVAILPLFLGKKLGFSAYVCPGRQYLDRSTLLIKSPDPQIVKCLLRRLSLLGSYSIAELPEYLAVLTSQSRPQPKLVSCSVGSKISVTPEPFPEMDKEHKRRILSKIKKSGIDLNFHIYDYQAIRHLSTLIEIENSSPKKALFRDILSDPQLIKLLKQIDRQDPRVIVIDILSYKGDPICYQMGFNYRDIHSGFSTAYKSPYRFLIPGKISIYFLLQYLHKIGITIVDMSRGQNSFKDDLRPQLYRQYEAFYSPHPLIFIYWQSVARLQAYFASHDQLYEAVRLLKNFIFKKIFAI